jgi:hypothetical protein
MDIVIYPLLGTTSRRAMLKEKSRFGRSYTYRPRGNLLIRLSKETGMPVEKYCRKLDANGSIF